MGRIRDLQFWSAAMLCLRSGVRRFHLLAVVLIAVCGSVLTALTQPLGRSEAELQARLADFLRVLEEEGVEYARPFFPDFGEWRYTRTIHEPDGSDRVEVSVYDAFETWPVLVCGKGPVRESLEIDYHGQKIGLFLDQAQQRRGAWRLVGGNRLVPPGADDSSATYIEWRREGEHWVISALADEWFRGEELPAWFGQMPLAPERGEL